MFFPLPFVYLNPRRYSKLFAFSCPNMRSARAQDLPSAHSTYEDKLARGDYTMRINFVFRGRIRGVWPHFCMCRHTRRTIPSPKRFVIKVTILDPKVKSVNRLGHEELSHRHKPRQEIFLTSQVPMSKTF